MLWCACCCIQAGLALGKIVKQVKHLSQILSETLHSRSKALGPDTLCPSMVTGPGAGSYGAMLTEPYPGLQGESWHPSLSHPHLLSGTCHIDEVNRTHILMAGDDLKLTLPGNFVHFLILEVRKASYQNVVLYGEEWVFLRKCWYSSHRTRKASPASQVRGISAQVSALTLLQGHRAQF